MQDWQNIYKLSSEIIDVTNIFNRIIAITILTIGLAITAIIYFSNKKKNIKSEDKGKKFAILPAAIILFYIIYTFINSFGNPYAIKGVVEKKWLYSKREVPHIKINKIEKIFNENKKKLYQYLNFFSYKDVKNIYKIGKKFKYKRSIKNLYQVKRLLVNCIFFNEGTYYYNFVMRYFNLMCFGEKKKTCNKESWMLFDNDIKTTVALRKNNFSIKIGNDSQILIFNGRGESKEEFENSNKIKSMWAIYKNRKIKILLKNNFGWQTIKLPSYVKLKKNEYLNFKVGELYSSGKDNNLVHISEIKPKLWTKLPNNFYGKYLYEKIMVGLRK